MYSLSEAQSAAMQTRIPTRLTLGIDRTRLAGTPAGFGAGVPVAGVDIFQTPAPVAGVDIFKPRPQKPGSTFSNSVSDPGSWGQLAKTPAPVAGV